MKNQFFFEKTNFEEKKPSTILDLFNRVDQLFKTEPNTAREIQVQLGTLVSQLYHAALNNSEGFCYKFGLPIVAVQSLYKKIKTSPAQVEEIFRQSWGYPKNTKMYSDPYYQILLLMLFYGLRTNNKGFVNSSLLLILIKLWNGRRQEFLPFCNPNVMKYVTQNMLSNKFHAAKHDTPLSLLANYFVPSLLKKYGDAVKNDPMKLKVLFSQAYTRIFQLFYQQPKINPTTGKKESTSGLAALYYKAHSEGATSRDITVRVDDEEKEATYDQFGSTHNLDEIITSTSEFIVLNKQTSYPEGLVKQLNRLTHVSAKVINNLGIDMHSPEYHDLIRDILTLILGRLNIKDKSDICSSQFIFDIKKKIISSKNNVDSKKIVSLVDEFLIRLFKKRNLSFDRYSVVQRIQIRTVLIHLIVFNLKRVVCHQQASAQFNFLSTLKTSDII